jgi:ribose 5-phosphate isomerase RpiB
VGVRTILGVGMKIAVGSDERTNDAQTARGARKWNDANVLAMSLRSTPQALAKEIVDAWLETGPDEAERETIAKVERPHPAMRGSGD